MSFKLLTMDVGSTPPIEYRKVTAGEDVAIGEALVESSGKLTKCSGTNKPAYVAVGPQNDDDIAPVVRLNGYMRFSTTLAVAPAEGTTLKAGDKLTLHTNGMQVTATTNGGVAEVIDIAGQTVGSDVTVRF